MIKQVVGGLSDFKTKLCCPVHFREKRLRLGKPSKQAVVVQLFS